MCHMCHMSSIHSIMVFLSWHIVLSLQKMCLSGPQVPPPPFPHPLPTTTSAVHRAVAESAREVLRMAVETDHKWVFIHVVHIVHSPNTIHPPTRHLPITMATLTMTTSPPHHDRIQGHPVLVLSLCQLKKLLLTLIKGQSPEGKTRETRPCA